MVSRTRIRRKDLDFVDKLLEKELVTGKIRKVVFPNSVTVGREEDGTQNLTVFGDLVVCGSLSAESVTSGSQAGGADPGAAFVLIGNTGSLENERALTAGAGINIADGGANSTVTISAVAGVHAPADAPYLTLATDGDLSAERVFTPGTGLLGTDGGADNPYTLEIDDSIVATLTGSPVFEGHISGTSLSLAGGVFVDGFTDNDDLVIGAGIGEHGITLFSDSGGTGATGITWTDDGTTRRGGVHYDHANDRFFFRTGGASRIVLNNNSLVPVGSKNFGSPTEKWITSSIEHVTGSRLLLAGALEDDGPAQAHDLVIGRTDGDHGLTIVAGTSSEANIVLTDAVGVRIGGMRYLFGSDELALRTGGSDKLDIVAGGTRPGSDNVYDLGSSGRRWENFYVAGTANIDTDVNVGVDLSMTGSDPNLTVGDGTGAADILVDSALANDADILFQSAGINNWIWRRSTTTRDFVVNRRTAAGGNLDNPLIIDFDTGDITLGNTVNITGSLTVADLTVTNTGSIEHITGSRILLGGAQESGDAVPGATDIVIGNGSTDAGITVFVGDTSTGRLSFTDAAGLERGELRYDADTARWHMESNGSHFLNLNSAAVWPNTTDIVELGLSTRLWEKVWTLDLFAAGTANIDGDVSVGADLSLTGSDPTLLVGDGTGTPAIEIDKSDAGTSALRYRNAGIKRWDLGLDTGEAFTLNRFNASAGHLDNPFTISVNTGDIAVANDLNLTSSSPILVVGDNSASPSLQINKGSAGDGTLQFSLSTDAKRIRHNSSEELDIDHWNGGTWETIAKFDSSKNVSLSDNLSLTSSNPTLTIGDQLDVGPDIILNYGSAAEIKFVPLGFNSYRVAGSGNSLVLGRWNGSSWINAIRIDSTPDVNISNDLALTSSSPNLDVGDSTGSPDIALLKSAAGASRIVFRNTGGNADWVVTDDASESFLIKRFIAGVSQDTPIAISNATGDITIADDFALTSSSPNLTLGDGNGAPNLILDKDAGGQGEIFFNSDSLTEWIIQVETDEDFLIRRYNAGASQDIPLEINHGTGHITASTIVPTADDTDDLGSSDLRWANFHVVSASFGAIESDGVISGSTIHLLGANFGSANVLADDIVIGNGDAVDYGITIFTGASQTGRLVFIDTAGSNQGVVSYDHSNTRFVWTVETSDEMILTNTVLGPISDDGLSLGDASLRFLDGFFGGDVDIEGALTAATKSFLIDHPTKPDMKLHHGSLEGPEYGVYVRGKTTGKITLPDYWKGLVDPDSITVQLTPIGKHQKLFIDKESISEIVVKEEYSNKINAYYFVQAERIDVDKLEVEQQKEKVKES